MGVLFGKSFEDLINKTQSNNIICNVLMKQTHSQCTEVKTEVIYILNTQDVKGRAHCEGDRVPVVEKHTNRLRTGLAAPTPEDLPSWLERHPTYEVLVPTAKKSPPIVTSPTCKLLPLVRKIFKNIRFES